MLCAAGRESYSRRSARPDGAPLVGRHGRPPPPLRRRPSETCCGCRLATASRGGAPVPPSKIATASTRAHQGMAGRGIAFRLRWHSRSLRAAAAVPWGGAPPKTAAQGACAPRCARPRALHAAAGRGGQVAGPPERPMLFGSAEPPVRVQVQRFDDGDTEHGAAVHADAVAPARGCADRLLRKGSRAAGQQGGGASLPWADALRTQHGWLHWQATRAGRSTR